MKTNIRMKVTPEQSEQVQKIVFANGGGWRGKPFPQEIRNTEHKCLFLNKEKELTYTEFFKPSKKYCEVRVNADLFIRTNGTCELDNTNNKKEPKYKVGDIVELKYSCSKYKIIHQEESDEILYKVKNMSNKKEHWVLEEYIDTNYLYIKADETSQDYYCNDDKCDHDKDNTTNPNHYNQMKIQPNEYITANKNCFSWNTANVIKYVSRYKSKDGIEDLEKAIKYLQFEIEELRKAEQ